MIKPVFEPGQVLVTSGISEVMKSNNAFEREVMESINRHLTGDWQDMDSDDQEANKNALTDGSRRFSAYITITGGKIWIITEAVDDSGHRSATTVLFPEEY